MLGKLIADTTLLQSRLEMTAQQFARADLRDPPLTLANHDHEVLEILHTRSANPAFEPVKSHLGTMISSLNGFVGASPSPRESCHDPPVSIHPGQRFSR